MTAVDNTAENRALAALWAVQREPGADFDSADVLAEDSATRENITDLITDLMHLAETLDLEDETGGQDVSDSALMHFYAEQQERKS